MSASEKAGVCLLQEVIHREIMIPRDRPTSEGKEGLELMAK